MILRKSVTLNPGEQKQVTFEIKPTEARIYQATIDGLAGSFSAEFGPVVTPYGTWYPVPWDPIYNREFYEQLKPSIDAFILRGEILSDVVARWVGWRGGDSGYWAYAVGFVPRDARTWDEMALAMGLYMFSAGPSVLMLMPDGSSVLATREMVIENGGWDVIIGYAAGIPQTVRMQIEGWQDVMADSLGWRFE